MKKKMYLMIVTSGKDEETDKQVDAMVRTSFPEESYVIHLIDDDQSFRMISNRNRPEDAWGYPL